jgi:hypothetical protein
MMTTITARRATVLFFIGGSMQVMAGKH